LVFEKILRNEVACVLKSLEDNPYLHQLEVDVNLPAGKYRRVVLQNDTRYPKTAATY
jgi:hypothetical protein